MKPKFLKLTTILLFFTFSFSCDKIENEDQYPGVSIYKTKGDYFNLVDIGMKGDKIFRTESFWNPRYNTMSGMIVKNNDTIYGGRYKLVDGYVLDGGAGVDTDVFLKKTHKQCLTWQITNDTGSIPDDTLRRYILDKDPYTEFYQNRTDVKRFYIEDSLEIKQIMLNGELDKYFEKIK